MVHIIGNEVSLLREFEQSKTFLLLGICFQLTHHTEEVSNRTPPEVVSSIDSLGAQIRPVLLLDTTSPPPTDIWYRNSGRLLVSLNDVSNPEEKALRIANALQSLMNFMRRGGPLREELIPLKIVESMCSEGRILLPDLVNLYNCVWKDDRSFDADLFPSVLKRCLGTTESRTAWAFFYLPTVLKDASLFEAVHFYQDSTKDVAFVGDDIRIVLSEPEEKPVSRHDQTTLETALGNAFKAVEAIIGEPNKNDRRFRNRLEKSGINPDMTVGFEDDLKDTIFNKIRWLHGLRDPVSHGRTGKRPKLTYNEVMEAQYLSHTVVTEALFHITSEHGRCDGLPEERRYLLSQMFHPKDIEYLHSAFEGTTPEEIVATPDGFEKIFSSLGDS